MGAIRLWWQKVEELEDLKYSLTNPEQDRQDVGVIEMSKTALIP